MKQNVCPVIVNLSGNFGPPFTVRETAINTVVAKTIGQSGFLGPMDPIFK